MSVIVMQNPNLVGLGGFESLGKSLYPKTSVGFNIPVINKKLAINYSEEDKKTFENYFGFKFDSPEGIEFYGDYQFTLPEHVTSFNLENPVDNFTYRTAVLLGYIVESKEDIKSPMCNAIFYVHSSKLDAEEKAKTNRLKAKCLAKLDDLYENSSKEIIWVAKYLFNSYTDWNKDKALNELIEFIDKSTARNKNSEEVEKALNLNKNELKFVVDVKEAISRSIIRKNAKGNFYNTLTNTEFGKTLDEVLDFLRLNDSEMGEGTKEDSHYTIRKQLNN